MSAKLHGALAVYKGKGFARFARKARIDDKELWLAARRANEGLIDADLGGGVIKQRVARTGEGKSGGSRSLVLFRKDDRAIFALGFEKKDQADIKPSDLAALKSLAGSILAYTLDQIAEEVRVGALIPIKESQDEEIPE